MWFYRIDVGQSPEYVSFKVENQTYTLNGTSLIVPVAKVVLSPVYQNIDFSYSAKLADGNELLRELIAFDSQRVQFEISSDN